MYNSILPSPLYNHIGVVTEANERNAILHDAFQQGTQAVAETVILLDWSGVDLGVKSTPYAKKLVELQDSNAAPDQIYAINSKSWQRVGV